MTNKLKRNQDREIERFHAKVESQLLGARNKIIEFKWTSPHEYTITVEGGVSEKHIQLGFPKEII